MCCPTDRLDSVAAHKQNNIKYNVHVLYDRIESCFRNKLMLQDTMYEANLLESFLYLSKTVVQ